MAARQGDLGLLEERSQKIFWGMEHRDLKTVAFSIVVIDGERREITTVNKNKIHAEILFIRQARMLMGQTQGVNIEITINLSKSPCFTCREDLEDFFESLTKGATVTFTLRIANLYCGVGTPGGEDKHIEYLASWICHLNRIVHTLDIQPILVLPEIPDYRPRGVSDAEWDEKKTERRGKDTRIATIVNTVEEQRTIAQRPGDTRRLFTTLTDKLTAIEKRKFIKSRATRAEEYVAVAQVQINAVNNVGRMKRKVFRPIKIKRGESGCCDTIPLIIKKIVKMNKKPNSWRIQSNTIVLAVTNFPCKECIINITRIRYEISPILILRVANVPYDKAIIVDWLFERYRAEITVQLHAIRVAVELGRVNCKQDAPQQEARQWRLAQRQRPGCDGETEENVQQIKNELSFKKECMRLNSIFERMQIVDDGEAEENVQQIKNERSFKKECMRLNSIFERMQIADDGEPEENVQLTTAKTYSEETGTDNSEDNEDGSEDSQAATNGEDSEDSEDSESETESMYCSDGSGDGEDYREIDAGLYEDLYDEDEGLYDEDDEEEKMMFKMVDDCAHLSV